MSDRAKLAVIEILRGSGSSAVRDLPAPGARSGFLGWIDQSGLTLYFLEELQRRGLAGQVDRGLGEELQRRRRDNCARTLALFRDFAEVNDVLAARDVSYAVLKGFSLVPEFCAAPELRHQTDIDVLVAPPDTERATAAISELGYCVESVESSGEVRLATPTRHVPSARDYLYEPPWQRRVELHVAPWEEIEQVGIDAGTCWLDRRVLHKVDDARFPVLAPADAVLHQALHLFRHVLQSWIRLGWLYESAIYLRRRRDDAALWQEVSARMAANEALRNACCFVFALARKVFAVELPPAIAADVERLPESLARWIERHAEAWTLAEFPGDHHSLLVHRDFVHGEGAWRAVRHSRGRRLLANVSAEKIFNPLFLAAAMRKRAVYAWSRLRWPRSTG